jgi:hypothetical protein
MLLIDNHQKEVFIQYENYCHAKNNAKQIKKFLWEKMCFFEDWTTESSFSVKVPPINSILPMTSVPRRRGDQIVSFKYSGFQPGVRESMGVREKYQIIPIDDSYWVLHGLHFLEGGTWAKKRLGTTVGMHLNLVGVLMTLFCDEPDLRGKKTTSLRQWMHAKKL